MADDQTQDGEQAATGTTTDAGAPAGAVGYVEWIVRRLVANPDRVRVEESVEDGERYIDVDVAAEDRGRVIGRDGRLIRSLRVIVRAATGREGLPATVDVLDDEDVAEEAPAGEAAVAADAETGDAPEQGDASSGGE